MPIFRNIWFRKILLFVVGIFIMALGVAFSVKSDLGVSPVTSLPYVMARATGITLGVSTVIIYLFNMLLQALILRRDYKLINLFQIAASFAFGYFTDATLWLVSFLPATGNYIVRFVYLILGVLFVALGVLLYLTTDTIALPTDGTVQAISRKGGFKLHNVKMIYDCVSTALALGLSYIAMRDINGIGVGTIIAAFGVGRALGVFTKLFKNALVRFLQPNRPAADGSSV